MDPLLETPPTEVTFPHIAKDFDNNTCFLNIDNRVDTNNMDIYI